MNQNIFKYLFLISLGLGSALPVFAQTESATPSLQNQLLWFLVFALLVLAITILTMTFTVMVLLGKNRALKASASADETSEEIAEKVAETKPSPFSWKAIRQKLTDAVPIAREAEIDLGHNYDGIRELDNNLPPWWKYGFYLSILFAVVYLGVYHFPGSGWSSEQEYQAEMAEAAVQKEEYLKKVANMVNESNVAILTDESSLAAGKAIYMASCLACHGDHGQGGVGPNLTDQYWINGGSIGDIFKTIKYGVPEKGMISWQDQLKPKEMQEVSSFIITFQGTNPPDGKAPQGELYTPEEEPPKTDTASVAMIN